MNLKQARENAKALSIENKCIKYVNAKIVSEFIGTSKCYRVDANGYRVCNWTDSTTVEWYYNGKENGNV